MCLTKAGAHNKGGDCLHWIGFLTWTCEWGLQKSNVGHHRIEVSAKGCT